MHCLIHIFIYEKYIIKVMQWCDIQVEYIGEEKFVDFTR